MKKVRKNNLGDSRCQEKRRSHAIWCPYRKPTQVDEERILRRPDECSLRNSAKKQVYLRYIPCPFACWVYGKIIKALDSHQLQKFMISNHDRNLSCDNPSVGDIQDGDE